MSEIRKDYEMTEADLDKIKEACKPVPMIMLQCGTPSSPQENANRAWARLGESMGFDPMSVQPNGKGDRFFSAIPTIVAKCDMNIEECASCVRQGDCKRDIPTRSDAVYVRNDSGAEAKCVVESMGQKFIRLRGIAR